MRRGSRELRSQARVAVLLLLILSACTESAPAPSEPTPTATEVREPPDTSGPGAALCSDAPDGDIVEFSIEPDVAAPRCSKARVGQRLSMVNRTDGKVRVELAGQELELGPGESGSIDEPFGAYLQPGLHGVSVSAYGGSGPELWLVP